MEYLSLQAVQEAEFHILCKLDDICEEQGFTYYLAAGTLIGAIRHRDFIPWDDDIDIWMPRESYEKFIRYCNAHEKELGHYRVLNRTADKSIEYSISRFCDMNYKLEFTNGETHDSGLFVDIYPLDYAGDTVAEAHRLMRRAKIQKRLGDHARLRHWPAAASAKMRLVNVLAYPYARLRGAAHFDRTLQKIATSVQGETKYMTCLLDYTYKFKALFPAACFEARTQVPFHGRQFWAPAGWHEVLTQLYGDYMQPPPVEKRRTDRHMFQAYVR